MINLTALTDAFTDTLQRIPQLVGDLANADPASIIGYAPTGAIENQASETIYGQLPGTVLVMWKETRYEGGINPWTHTFCFYVRSMRGQPGYTLIDDIMNGVPNPGDGQRWRRCAVMPGVDPTDVTEITSPIDEEGIDYFTIMTETKEIGDQ